MEHFVFEVKLSYKGLWGNLLAFIPRVFVYVSSAPSIKLDWMGLELELWCGIVRSWGNGFYLTPSIVFKRLDKKFKEKYDFQFSWLGWNYRKAFGERCAYEMSLKDNDNLVIE